MAFTPGTGGHGPREPREPRKAFVCRPVMGNISFSECDHFELVPVGVLEKLDVDPPASDQRVVAAGERQPAGDEVDVRAESQLVSASPAQDQGVGADTTFHSSRSSSTRLTGLVCGGIQQDYKGDVVHRQPLQLLYEQLQARLTSHCCLART